MTEEQSLIPYGQLLDRIKGLSLEEIEKMCLERQEICGCWIVEMKTYRDELDKLELADVTGKTIIIARDWRYGGAPIYKVTNGQV